MESDKSPSSPSQNPPEPSGLLYILYWLFGFLSAWFFSKVLNSPVPQSAETIQPQHTTNQKSEQTIPPLPIAVTIESYPPPSISKQDQTDKKEERWLKRGNFVATLATAIFAGLLLCVTSKYVRYTYNMWVEMQRQTKIASDQLEANTRPWIGIIGVTLTREEIVGSSPDISDPSKLGVRMDFTVSVQNYGGSPAWLFIQPEGRRGVRHDLLAWNEQIWGSCKTAEESIASRGNLSENIIFPKQPPFESGPYTITINSGVTGTNWIGICAAYKGSFGETRYTRVLYQAVKGQRSIPVPNITQFRYQLTDHFLLRQTDAN